MKLKDKLPLIAQVVQRYALSLGWKLEEARIASTGTCYIELYRRKNVGKKVKGEWVMIRAADHKTVYPGSMKIYSISPSELSIKAVRKILRKPFGKVGDVLL